MIKKIITITIQSILIFCFSYATLSLVGCETPSFETRKRIYKEDRFELIYWKGQYNIVLDKQTEKKYLFVTNGYGGGLTLLEE